VEEHWAKLKGVNAGKKVALAWQHLLERKENPNEGGSGEIQADDQFMVIQADDQFMVIPSGSSAAAGPSGEQRGPKRPRSVT
jgi:hypothetical protein